MNNEELEETMKNLSIPDPDPLHHQRELKVPLLRYRRSSIVGVWLLAVPLLFILTAFLKYEIGPLWFPLNIFEGVIMYINEHPVLTYLIPLLFTGLPLYGMVINLLSFCHFARRREEKELLITIKFRPWNIALFLFSFMVLVYFFLPDAMP